MRNIIRIFASDAKHLYTNVVAVVVIIGLSVIPSLYAWFNILSNWAPYEKEATSQLSVAVATADEGTDLDGIEVNVGQIVVDNLKENDSINWVFLDSSYEAVEQVESGQCYAALVIDQNFSEDMLSFIGGDLNHPRIIYYENEKKNAIAPKITGKVKTTVQEEVNKAFVSTLAETMVKASAYIVSGEDSDTAALSDSALSKLKRMDSDLSTSVAILNSFISLIDASDSLMEATKGVTDELDYIENNSRAMINAADAAADSGGEAVSTVSDMVMFSLEEADGQLAQLESLLSQVLDDVQTAGRITEAQAASIRTAVSAVQAAFQTTSSGVKGQYNSIIDAGIDDVDTNFNTMITNAKALEACAQGTQQDAQSLLNALLGEVSGARESLQTLSNDYKNTVEPQLSSTMSAIGQSLNEVSSLLNYSSSGIQELSDILGSYPDMLSMGKGNLESTRDEILGMQGDLQGLISDMEGMEENEQYKMLLKLIETDPEVISDFISDPIDLNQQNIYEVENNGSATAPFYIVLSIWVGALILVALVHTKVEPIPGVEKMTTFEEFFGRYIVFFLIGQLQTVITVFGALFFTQIQCQHKFLFWLACSFTSFTFTLLLYSLTYAFEAVGEAVAVVLMVLQVAGSGGTFPVEVLPVVYQLMYKYMPFAYGMNAIRECVAGMYENDYWVYMSGLLTYIGVALVIGLVLSIPCKKLNLMIKESKEKTDLMI
ncbi:MAG: YhgE/Pip domain-containing protein [Lachnospiraceae bacterium]|nr:YhgE/Pip domain-containing protein [Lachnospiraceae bacterium]